ncbi:MAG: type II secretion system F family protein [Candidatus Riflebacteria bacterium]|nr:type II secretion system F family protein [Candidatus Riflebacteria bacterium]
MNEQNLRREVITFCQLVSVALRSGRPIPEALSDLSGRLADTQASIWAKNLAQKMSEGHPVDEICHEMSGFDPVLARLMPLLGNGRLLKVLELYTGFLVNLERVHENLKSALFYPTVVISLLLANLVQLNFGLFKHVFQSSAVESADFPLMLRLLYFAEVDLWPFSLPVPLLMLATFIFMARAMLLGRLSSSSVVARVARFSDALRLQEKGRLLGVISLYLQAGFSVTNAVEKSAELAGGSDTVALNAVARALGNGEKQETAFALSSVLSDFAEGAAESAALPERLQYASESNYRHSYSLLRRISNEMMLVALLLTGVFVMLITSGVFGSYYWAIWSI